MFQTLSDGLGGERLSAQDHAQVASSLEVVERAQQGDAIAFAELFRIYNASICTYLARLVSNDELGRDLAQETFLRAWKSLPSLRTSAHFKAWLYRIATNVANSHLRHDRLIRWLPWTTNDANVHERDFSIEGPEENIGESECVERALRYLSPQCRACLLLQLVGGFSQHEVAALLGISEKSVGAYVSRGREQFRQVYRRMKGADV